MATIVRVRGSAYRREGTRMLVRANGTYECALSGGCLEPAVVDAAQHVIRTGEPITATYDLAEDSVWGLGIGCMGAVDIRIERLETDPVFDAWLNLLEQGETAAFVTALSGPSGRMLVTPTGDPLGALADPAETRSAVARARERLRDPFARSGPEHIGAIELFFDISLPPPALVIFGAGYDVEPLAHQAWVLGFAVTIVDVREVYLSRARFPHGTLVCAHFTRFAELVPIDSGSFVTVMNHQVERDRESLRWALESPAAYIGVLGPHARFQRLLAALADAGYRPDQAALARVRSPMGLALGAETPDEVAVSVLAEMLAIRRGFAGGFLTGTDRSLHRPDETRLLARS
jgi:xanthine/CO dehydrogenase XdhC/CoxF family maturation factor